MLKRLDPDVGESLEVKVRGLAAPVVLRRSARARRFSLQVNEARRGAVLTMPPYSSLNEAGDFLARHFVWLKQRIAYLPEPVPYCPGAVIPLRGEAYALRFTGGSRGRSVVTIEGSDASRQIPFWPETARRSSRLLPRLCVAGDRDDAPRRLADWLRREAQKDLKARVRWHARRLGVEPARISVRDQATRWGSCSSSGSLSFSWRLVLAPPFVLDYVAAHEVAHLTEMNHGPRFWALVKLTNPNAEEARRWLRRNGASLHRYGAEE